MPDWSASMQQSYEYYEVDPVTWKDSKKIDGVISSSITRELSSDTLESATIEVADLIGECYIRIYLVTIQNGVRERFPLGTFLVQTPSSTFDGKYRKVSMDAYSPLLELKENQPPLGYFLTKTSNVMDMAYLLVRGNCRAPVVRNTGTLNINRDFVADSNDTWLSYIKDLIETDKFSFLLDDNGRILFNPQQETESLAPVWDFDDNNSSIILPEIDMTHDIYGIPNVVEVIYSSGHYHYYSRIVNDDPNSPTSTISRGREIVKRIANPNFSGSPTQFMIDEYATNVLKEASSLEYTVSYTHAYCPVRIGDCVRLTYKAAGIENVKAKVISQSIECKPGTLVSEKAVFTNKLWR